MEKYSHIQEKLLSLLPCWNYQISKPFKQLLDEGISLEMYYCLKTLEWAGGSATMSQLAAWTKVPAHQMTKMVNKLVEQGLVSRCDDPDDRRIVRIRLTEKADEYMAHFLAHKASCFLPLLEQMSERDLEEFSHSLDTLYRIFNRLPSSRAFIESGRRAVQDDVQDNQ
ncbi:MarR family winged helix-turn-helix transcriptional regulator [uncultured Faecalibaculum sp.]|uniref:MarR family winged helix-turn-helix transcriptional regulator n=1 Tax=uncultured Faecalibaculum sp. TaxID=1729681 RepID=UPI002637F34B|nr:MarR family transcriptional regulator [uncultured Faecalibaculum sp.]